jgi:hypothetical protein
MMSNSIRLVQRIREEYQAVPRLKITHAQACRLWSAPEGACHDALDALVAEGVLWLAPSGSYVALPSSHGTPIKADLTATRCPRCQKRNPFERQETTDRRAVNITLRCVACHRVFSFSALTP